MPGERVPPASPYSRLRFWTSPTEVRRPMLWLPVRRLAKGLTEQPGTADDCEDDMAALQGMDIELKSHLIPHLDISIETTSGMANLQFIICTLCLSALSKLRPHDVCCLIVPSLPPEVFLV